MKHLILLLSILLLCTFNTELTAQEKFGQLKDGTVINQTIDISVYHQYNLNLKKGTIALLNITDFDVRTDLWAVGPDGFILEHVNTSETADFLIFEAQKNGDYDIYVNTIEGESKTGKYTITADLVRLDKNGRLGQIKELINLLEKPDRGGTAIAIVENGEVIFEDYRGYANIEQKTKIDSETIFELASVSKQFTAMAIAKLVEQGKVSVEDDIRNYFPELPMYKSTIKVKHLLNHTSGIIDSEYPLALAGFEDDPMDIDRVLNFLKSTSEVYFEPGSQFDYSNDGYTLLGELVSRVSKKSFHTWMQENIFEQLKMNTTLIRDSPEIIIPKRAISYMSYTGESLYRRLSFDFYAPGGCSVRSNISDLLSWVNYLNEGYHSKENLFQKINKLDTFNNGTRMEYSYGSWITDFRGIKRFSHLGLSAGFTTSIARFPEEDLSFIYLGNDGEFRNYYLARKIYEIYLSGKSATPNYKKFEGIETASFIENEPLDKKIEDLSLIDYEGTYFSQQINSSYSFELQNDILYAKSFAYEPIPLKAIAKDTFETDEDFMYEIVFKRDYNDKVSDCEIFNEDDDQSISFREIPSVRYWPKPKHWQSDVFLQRMRDSLEKIEASKILTGFAVSVFDESEIFFQEGYGYADIESEQGYNPETIQNIASISKSVTAMAIMKAMEMGFFRLDDPINEHLPFNITNPKFPDEEITIRHLLTHTSSLDDPDNYDRGYVFTKALVKENWPEAHYPYLPRYNNNQKTSLSDFLNKIIDPKSEWYAEDEMYTEYKPGTNFIYSNLGFALLGCIIEIKTKTDFRDFTQRHIFDPLDMKTATWDLAEVDPKFHATYYLENYNPCPDYHSNSIPDGGLFVNSIDLTKFLQEAIKGYGGRGKILTQASYTEMFRSQSDIIEIEGGLGWDLSIPCCIGHGGNDFGTSTLMYFEPRTGIGRIILVNTSAEIDLIADAYYGMMGLLFEED